MARSGITGATMLMALATVMGTAGAQGRGQGGRRDPLPEPGPPRASAGPASHSQVLDLNRKIVEAQQDLWDLRQHGAKADTIEAKRSEVLAYRYELARLLTDLPAGADVAVGPVGPPPHPPGGPAGPAPFRQTMGPPQQPRIYPLGPGYRPTAPVSSPPPPGRSASGPAPAMGPSPATRPYHAGVGYRPPVPMGSPPPAGMSATGLPPRVAGELPGGPRVYQLGVGYRPAGFVPGPRPYPCARAIPTRVQQSQQQSQGCGQQQQQQQSRGGQQQQQQQQGRRGQQQQQQQ